jgi:hypothetical protein
MNHSRVGHVERDEPSSHENIPGVLLKDFKAASV